MLHTLETVQVLNLEGPLLHGPQGQRKQQGGGWDEAKMAHKPSEGGLQHRMEETMTL